MADFSTNINNSVNLFGPQDTNKWGAITWGVHAWGYGKADLDASLNKLIANSLSLTNTVSTDLNIGANISNSLSISGDLYSEYLQDSAGYFYATGNGSNLENRVFTSYNSLTDITTSFTTQPSVGTTWSEQ